MMDFKKGQIDLWAGSNEFQVNYYFTFPPVVARSKWFAEQLKAYEFSSIYEPGIFSGRNLKYIADEFPEVKLGGLDVNEVAIKFARKKIPSAKFERVSIYEMPTEDKWDIVFTSGVLIHMLPDAIEDVVARCVEKANRYVMHIEAPGKNKVLSGPAHLKPKKVKDKFQWEPDIAAIYKKLGYKLSTVELPKDLKTNGASHLIIVDLSKEER